MTDATRQAQELTGALQEEATKTAQRVAGWAQSFVFNPADPPIGSTPRDMVWKRGKAQLFRYRRQTDRTYPVPYLIVPWLGISRPTVLDMLPGNSYIEFLVKQGFDAYLLDWGEIAEEDKDLGFEEAVCRILPRAVDRILDISGADEITLNGICLGGTMSASYLALNPDAPVRNFAAFVAPIDFNEGGMFKTWLDERYFPSRLILEHYGGLPANLMSTAFKMLRPMMDAQAFTNLWMNMDREEYVTNFKAMNHWATDFIGMPGRYFEDLSQELYFKNKLIAGEFLLGGRRVNLGNVQQPMLVVAARQDYIVPPLAAKGLMDAVSSKDKEYVELPGGHISVFSGRGARRTLWPKIDEWASARSS